MSNQKRKWYQISFKVTARNKNLNQASDIEFKFMYKLVRQCRQIEISIITGLIPRTKIKRKQTDSWKLPSEEIAQFSGVFDTQRSFSLSNRKRKALQSGLLSLNFTESSLRSSSPAFKRRKFYRDLGLEEKKDGIVIGRGIGNEGAV